MHILTYFRLSLFYLLHFQNDTLQALITKYNGICSPECIAANEDLENDEECSPDAPADQRNPCSKRCRTFFNAITEACPTVRH